MYCSMLLELMFIQAYNHARRNGICLVLFPSGVNEVPDEKSTRQYRLHDHYFYPMKEEPNEENFKNNKK